MDENPCLLKGGTDRDFRGGEGGGRGTDTARHPSAQSRPASPAWARPDRSARPGRSGRTACEVPAACPATPPRRIAPALGRKGPSGEGLGGVDPVRPVPHQAFPPTTVEHWQPNRLVVRLQPEEGILLRFQAKHSGPLMPPRFYRAGCATPVTKSSSTRPGTRSCCSTRSPRPGSLSRCRPRPRMRCR